MAADTSSHKTVIKKVMLERKLCQLKRSVNNKGKGHEEEKINMLFDAIAWNIYFVVSLGIEFTLHSMIH